MLLVWAIQPLCAQEEKYEDKYLLEISKRISDGDCEAAQKLYNVYKELSKNTSKDLEQRIANCKKQLALDFVDLGLPSGTLWCKRAEKYSCTYSEAINRYGNNIPTSEQWTELLEQCEWEWIDNGEWFEQDGERYMSSGECGYKIIGKNGKWIYIIANGYTDLTDRDYPLNVACGGIGGVGGYYYSMPNQGSNSKMECIFLREDNKGIREWDDLLSNRYSLNVIRVIEME